MRPGPRRSMATRRRRRRTARAKTVTVRRATARTRSIPSQHGGERRHARGRRLSRADRAPRSRRNGTRARRAAPGLLRVPRRRLPLTVGLGCSRPARRPLLQEIGRTDRSLDHPIARGARQMTKTLDRRLASILAGTYRPDDFIIADAKDADMGRGLGSAGPQPPWTRRPARGAGSGPVPTSSRTWPRPRRRPRSTSCSRRSRTARSWPIAASSRGVPSPWPSAPTTPPTSGWRATLPTPGNRRARSGAPISSWSVASATSGCTP